MITLLNSILILDLFHQNSLDFAIQLNDPNFEWFIYLIKIWEHFLFLLVFTNLFKGSLHICLIKQMVNNIFKK